MADNVLDTLDAQLEKVRQFLQPMYDCGDTVLSDRLNSSLETINVSRHLYRIPLKLYPGGIFTKHTLNAGVLGLGNASVASKMTAAYFGSKVAGMLTTEMMDVTDGNDVAVINHLNDMLADLLAMAKLSDELSLHGNGTGVLTEGASAYSDDASALWTFAGASDTLGVSRLCEGMTVDVWNSALSTNRGTARVIAVDYDNNTCNLSADVTGGTSTDKLVLSGMDVYGPSTLASATSGYPAAPASQVAAGIADDTFRHGIEYVNDATGANYYLGVQKSTVPQLKSGYVNAASSVLNWTHGLKLWSQLQQRRGNGAASGTNGIVGLIHMAQRAALFDQSVMLANKDIGASTKFGKSVDLLPDNVNYADKVDFAGVMCDVDRRQRKSRVDFVNPSTWGKAQIQELDFLTDQPGGGGNKFHRTVDSTTGTPKEQWCVYLGSAFDWFCVDPASGGYIDGLVVPSGY